jgi:DNA processing protein
MDDLSETECRFLLAHICEPGDGRINKLSRRHSWNEIISNPHLLPDTYRKRLSEIEKSKVLARLPNENFITPQHPHWPESLNDLADRTPIGLWFKGNIQNLNPLSVAIVGARSASNYGENIASDFAMKLAGLNLNVVSGGAFGIDAAAHHGALVGNGFTVAVMAGGVDVFYPKTNSQLFEKISEAGLLISEVPPGTIPIRHRFLIRNRLIAALARVTIVVEARIRSGAMSTAGEATQIGRDVVAVPGSVHSASSAGCHQLIRDGAILVTNVAEICELIIGDYPQYSH